MDLDPNSMAMRFALVSYHAYLFRYVDMCDTFFFIARKKYRNVNVLQVRRIHTVTSGLPLTHATLGPPFSPSLFI